VQDELEVQTRHKKTLEAIRLKKEEEDVDDDDTVGGYAATRKEIVDRDTTHVENGIGRDAGREEGVSEEQGTTSGLDRGSRSIDTEDQHTIKGNDPSSRETDSTRRNKRELNRQAKERQRDAARERAGEGLTDSKPRFRLKGLLNKKGPQAPTKLFSKKEAEDALSRLSVVYGQGSHLLDEILEVVVKDHEPVEIWQLAPDESDTLAALHLERAQYDQKAAQSARVLLSLYDKIFILMIAWPRVILTVRHIDKHRGVSLW
jgi:hypothetical protein